MRQREKEDVLEYGHIEDSANPRERPRTGMTLKMVPSEVKNSSNPPPTFPHREWPLDAYCLCKRV